MAKSAGVGMRVLGSIGGLALLMLSARLGVPMYPAPTTLVSFTAVLLGMLVGWREGTLIALLYAVALFIGLPHFLAEGRLAPEEFWDAKPTGYVIGLAAAAFAAGKLAPEGKGSFGRVFLAALAGHAVFLLCGMLWMLRFSPWRGVIAEELYPHLIPLLAKSAGAFLVAVGLRRFV